MTSMPQAASTSYAERIAVMRAMSPGEKLAIFEQELRARLRPLRILFDLAIAAADEEHGLSQAIPDIGTTIESLRIFNAAADKHYFESYYAPEIYSQAVFTALYSLNVTFATEALGLTVAQTHEAKAGIFAREEITFHELLCAIRSHVGHFHEHAQIKSIQEARVDNKKKQALRALQVFSGLGFELPLDSDLCSYTLTHLLCGSFHLLTELERSVGPGLLAWAESRK